MDAEMRLQIQHAPLRHLLSAFGPSVSEALIATEGPNLNPAKGCCRVRRDGGRNHSLGAAGDATDAGGPQSDLGGSLG